MAVRYFAHRNEYRCAIERNHKGRFCVRIRADFGRLAQSVSVYFLASTVDRALKELEPAIQHLQREEERLWVWGTDRSAVSPVLDASLREAGLEQDRRTEFPRKCSLLQLSPGRPMPAHLFEQFIRGLAQSVAPAHLAAAGD